MSILNYFSPSKSSLHVLSGEAWNNFSQENGLSSTIVGDYVPRDYSAYVKDSGNEEDVRRRVIHEYFGHGIFCECSRIGQQFVKLDKKVYTLEKILFEEKLPKNKLINIAIGEEKSLTPIKDSTDEFLAIVPMDLEEEAKYYLKLRKYSDKFKKETYQIYEGFALWVEEKACFEIKKDREGYEGYIEIKKMEENGINILLKNYNHNRGWD